MKRQIEHEVDRTMSYLDEFEDVQISSVFMDTLSARISHLHARRGMGYRSRAFYPVVIVLLVVMNIVVLTGSFKKQTAANGQYDQTSVMAAEYGIGQSSYMSL